MDDLISRQAAIDDFTKWKYQLADCFGEDYSGVSIVESAIKSLEGYPSVQPEQRWIPCSERLPEKADGKYWVCTDTGYQCECRWTDNVYGLGSNGEWAWKIFDIPQYSHVVAWMPLPEPWRAERREDDGQGAE